MSLANTIFSGGREGRRYAVIKFAGKERNNLGDQFLVQTSRTILNLAGIPDEDILEIDYEDLPTWESRRGDHVLLLVTFPFLRNAKINQLFSEYIDPIFIGFFWADHVLTDDETAYLKKFEPIGCRDEYTYHTMKKHGVKAWLNGCSTIVNEYKNIKVGDKRELFLVDVPENIVEKFPPHMIQGAKSATQMIGKDGLNGETPMSFMKKRYERYAKEACRVVTTKLHCAMACLCMGIPTIVVQNTKRLPVRMAWLEKLLPVYTVDELSDIDWDCGAGDISYIKKAVAENAVNLIKTPYVYHPLMDRITEYYLDRDRKEYFVEGYTSAVEYIKDNFNPEEETQYAFWGITIFTDMLQRYMKENYPHAVLADVIDKYKTGEYAGVGIRPISNTDACLENVHLFVTAENAVAEAEDFIRENELKKYHLIV